MARGIIRETLMKEAWNIEIGSGFTPYIHVLRKDLLREGHLLYYDKSRALLVSLAQTAVEEGSIVQGNRVHLPLSGDSVDAIFAKDLFGRLQFDPPSVSANMAQEWYRVCQPGGRAIVVEIATPADMTKTAWVFGVAGFLEAERRTGNDVAEMFKPPLFRGAQMLFRPDAYALVFEKPA